MSTKELENFITTILENPEFETTPPDQLASVTYVWHGENLQEIKEIAKSLPTAIVRAKGFVQENDVIHLFSYVMGNWTLEPYANDAQNIKDIKYMNMIVFIGDIAAIGTIGKTMTTPNWSAREILQPFGLISKL